MGRYAENPESTPVPDEEGTIIELDLDGDGPAVVVVRPAAGAATEPDHGSDAEG